MTEEGKGGVKVGKEEKLSLLEQLNPFTWTSHQKFTLYINKREKKNKRAKIEAKYLKNPIPHKH